MNGHPVVVIVYFVEADSVHCSWYILCDDVVGDGPVESPHLLALEDDGLWRRVEAVVAPQLDGRRVLDARGTVSPVKSTNST